MKTRNQNNNPLVQSVAQGKNLTSKSKKWIIITILIFFGLFVIGGLIITCIFIVNEFHSSNMSKFDINNCDAAIGSTWFDDYSISNKVLCYEERAYTLNDWSVCHYSTHPGGCLSKVSRQTRTYLCDKGSTKNIIFSCNYNLLSYHRDIIHSLVGIEKYKVSKSIQLKSGGTFILSPVTVSEDGRVEFFAQSIEYCSENMTTPLAVNTVGGGTNYIFITNCSVIGDSIKIDYFKYNFEGLVFPEGI